MVHSKKSLSSSALKAMGSVHSHPIQSSHSGKSANNPSMTCSKQLSLQCLFHSHLFGRLANELFL